MTDYFDALETRTPADREAALMAALPRQIAHAQAHSAAMGEILAGVDAAAITSRAALAQLPVTRKSELLARQQASRAAGRDASRRARFASSQASAACSTGCVCIIASSFILQTDLKQISGSVQADR